MNKKNRFSVFLTAVLMFLTLVPAVTAQAADYNAAFGAQFNPEVNADVGEWPDLSEYNITFDMGEEVTLTIEFDAPVAFGGNYAAIDTDFPANGAGSIISLKLDGNEVPMGAAYLNNEGIDGGLRLTICNKWNGDITEQPVDVETLGEFSKLEVTFVVNKGEDAAEEAPPEPAGPDFDPNGAYNAYLGVQSQNFIFRNAWADASYGEGGGEWANQGIGNNFFGLTGWDANNAVKKDGVFTDAKIAGNGTYIITLEDYDFGDDEFFNLLFISSDIPLKGDNVKFTDVKVKMNNRTVYTFDNGYVVGIDNNEQRDYYEVQCINIWSADLGGDEGLFGYVMPSGGPISIEFTVSGFAYDKQEEAPVAPAAEETSGETPSGSESSSTPPTTEQTPDNSEGSLLIAKIVGAVIIIIGFCCVFYIVGKQKKGK